jgi:Multisubunit Na+/H+ antiporter, MnhF subunit
MTAQSITLFAVQVGLFVLGVSFLLTVWRVVRGPTLPDRVIALDMLVGIVMGFIALVAIRTGFTLYIDIAISLGLVGFLATVAFARFILSRKRREGEDGAPPEPLPPRLLADEPAAKPARKGRAVAAAPVAAPKEAPKPALSKSEATKASAAKVKIAKAKAAKKAAPAETAAATSAAMPAGRKTPRKPAVGKETP